MAQYEEIANFIQKSCFMLDEEDFEGFLAGCSSNFQYKIIAFSPELNKEMIWMDEDYQGMQNLFSMIPSHLRRLGKLMRHVSIGQVDRQKKAIRVNSSFLLTHTDFEGKTNIFCVGRYQDMLICNKNPIFLESRVACIETRDLGIGSHVPI